MDVIVPCYNYGHFLSQCVNSVLSQDGVDVRVLIIDDCSRDNTPEVGRALAAEDSRVEYRRHATNHGHIRTYNEGFEWVSGNAVLLLSADDYLLPGALRRASRVMGIHPEVGLVYGRQVVIRDEIHPSGTDDNSEYEVIEGGELIRQMCDGGSNPVTTPTTIVRSEVLRAVGEYNPKLPHTADMEYWLRVAARCSIAVLAAQQACKRMHTHNMQVDFVTQVERDIEQRSAAFASFFDREGKYVAAALELRQKAYTALAGQAFWAASQAFDLGQSAECEKLLGLAKRLSPNLPGQRCWSRLAWKRRIGVRAWRAIRPLFN
jgi:glycosyltransferase involved in cell wall biosynthesis